MSNLTSFVRFLHFICAFFLLKKATMIVKCIEQVYSIKYNSFKLFILFVRLFERVKKMQTEKKFFKNATKFAIGQAVIDIRISGKIPYMWVYERARWSYSSIFVGFKQLNFPMSTSLSLIYGETILISMKEAKISNIWTNYERTSEQSKKYFVYSGTIISYGLANILFEILLYAHMCYRNACIWREI